MRNLLIVIILTLAYSCTEQYDLTVKPVEPRLVVEGTVTNEDGPNYVRLTLSSSEFNIDFYTRLRHTGDSTTYYRSDMAIPIQDAKVFITDKNTLLTDTLVPCSIGEWLIMFIDTINNRVYKEFRIPRQSISYGYYETTKLKGVPGHTYALTVKWQDQEYHAESYMPPVPAIDSVHFNYTVGEIGKEDFNIPLIYFKEPQSERNYYLFNTNSVGGAWAYSVLSDEYLKDYVNGLDVCKGVSPDYWRTAYPQGISGFSIQMHSLTREAYNYYKALLEQFRTDGGGYSPSPASPPTNMDNGALGFFRASSVSRVDFKQEVSNQ